MNPNPPTLTVVPAVDELGRLGRALADAEAAFSEQARQLRLALEGARTVVWEMEPAAGTLRYAESPEVLREIGFRPEFLPVDVESWRALLHPDDRVRVEGSLTRSFAEGVPFDEEYRVVLDDGDPPVRWIATRGRIHPAPQGATRMLGLSLDVTGRKLMEAALRQREETLRAVFSASPDVINVLDAEGNVRLASPAARNVLGYHPEERPSASTLERVHLDDRKRVARAMRAVLDGREEELRLRFRYRHAAGHWVVLETDGRRITDVEGRPTGVVVVSRDVTKQAELEEALQNTNRVLERKGRERTRELEETQLEILERLARAAELRDDDTGQHTRRVGEGAAELARALGLPRADVELIRLAAPLHDVGKIGIPDAIFLKPGRLTPEEFAVVKTHTTIGAEILSGGEFPLLQMAERIALSHHERWDGGGYPHGLRGEEIPRVGRIVAVVDVFDALTHARPYKSAWPREEALEEIRRQSGRQFDPTVAEAFLRLRQAETP